MKGTAAVYLAGVMAGMLCTGPAGADEVVPERHDSRIVQAGTPREGRRLLDRVPGTAGELFISGGISAVPCRAGEAERQGNRIRIPLDGCGGDGVRAGYAQLPARVLWRTDSAGGMVTYFPAEPGDRAQLILPVSRARPVSLLHLTMSYE